MCNYSIAYSIIFLSDFVIITYFTVLILFFKIHLHILINMINYTYKIMYEGRIMNAVLIDDNNICLETESEVIKSVDMIDELHSFLDINSLITYISDNTIDVAFLDIIMNEVDGITLAMEIKRLQPKCKIIFISSSRDFAMEAFQVYTSGYLLKPVSRDEITELLINL